MPKTRPLKPIRWAYGVTTVPERRDNLLPQTLESLAKAGFDEPHIFVDGISGDYDALIPPNGKPLLLTLRLGPPARAYTHWVASLWELYGRNPTATHYAMFQDDILVSRGLRAYLELHPLPDKVYLNPYCSLNNAERIKRDEGEEGWHRSDQMGRGALALVFNRQGVMDLLGARNVVQKPTNLLRGFRNLDGAVAHALVNAAGYVEYVHNPSLVFHTGTKSIIGNQPFPAAPTWRGEDYNAIETLGHEALDNRASS